MKVKGGHEPTLGTVMMVERTILRAKDYPTKTTLWRNLPRKVQYQTFMRVIDYLISSNKIVMNENHIVWVFPDNPKLKRLLKTSVKVR